MTELITAAEPGAKPGAEAAALAPLTTASGGVGAARRGRWRALPGVVTLCFGVVGAVVVMVVFGTLLTPHEPAAQSLVDRLQSPSGDHWLGTDALGRDVLSRLIVGARTAFVGGLVISASSMVIGNLLGLWAGYRGGRVDAAVVLWVDLMRSIPSLLVIIVVQGALGGGYWVAVGLLVALTVPFDTRVVRGAALEQVTRPYVEAAKTVGVADWRIVVRHVWPNVSPVTVANSFLVFSSSMVALAGLSFLGLGVEPGTADWGPMMSEGRAYLLANPVACLAPGAMVVVTAVSMNLIGDWVFERMSSRGVTR